MAAAAGRMIQREFWGLSVITYSNFVGAGEMLEL